MNGTPSVSVVLPVYNGQRFVAQAIESVLAQSFVDFELLLVDDASTDATAQIISGYLDDGRIEYIPIPHAGVTGALNAGLHAARGRYIARLDADDAMAPNRLAEQFAFLERRPEVAGIGSYYHVMDEAGLVVGAHQPRPTSVDELQRHLELGGKLILPHPTMMLRRELMLDHGGYRPEFEKCEDVDLFLRMVRGGAPLIIIPEYLTYFRVHSGSVSARSSRRQYFLNELIHANYRRHRKGLAEMGESEFASARRNAAWWRRVAWAAAREAAVFKRRYDDLRFAGKPRLAGLALLAAALLDPVTSWSKLRRTMRRSRHDAGLVATAV